MQLASLFATPVASFDHADLKDMNRALTELMLVESATSKSKGLSNVGNWHSENNLHERTEPCFERLRELIRTNAWTLTESLLGNQRASYPKFEAQLRMWCMVMRDGHYTKPHTHANTHWAVVYYPDVGDTDKGAHKFSGDISFLDPRMAYNPVPGIDVGLGEFMVVPKTGQMLVFPGWLTHYVHAYRGSKPRVSIACNVTYQ